MIYRALICVSLLLTALATLPPAAAGVAEEGRAPRRSIRQARPDLDAELTRRAEVGGKYSRLIARIQVPEDRGIYSDFYDYGRWEGTEYKGATNLRPGYWVYVYPYWYVWETQAGATGDRIPLQPAGRRAWGPEQAVGAPDTFEAGDLVTAWASLSQDEQDEWLDLRYAESVSPAAVLVHETYNPGAVVRVSAFQADGREVTVWSGTDPLEPGSGKGVAVLPFRTDFKMSRVRIYLASKKVPGWNEIDAVGLVDEFGRTQWAVSAEASSTFAHQRGEGFPPGLGGGAKE